MTQTRLISLLAFCLLLMPALTYARPVPTWQPAELVQKADLVVIATVRSTGDNKAFDLKSVHPGHGTWVPVETLFDVQAVVKGQFSGRMLMISHYRYLVEDRFLVVDGPAFVVFDPKKKSRYLIYLQRRGDHYEPLTGQYDPELSFYEIQPYGGALEIQALPNR